MSHTYIAEYTDTFAGEANYSWVRRETITMPELTHYGYDGGTNYVKANKTYRRELMKKAKSALGLTGVRGVSFDYGQGYEFRPYRSCTVLFINYVEE
jgi:heme/copper-type cytochrome/quinol oxidase subunit 3